jgi:hypothetical protein
MIDTIKAQPRVSTRCQNNIGKRCELVATEYTGSKNLCAIHASQLRPWAIIEPKPEPEHYADKLDADLCRIIYHTDLSFSEKLKEVDKLNKFNTFAS